MVVTPDVIGVIIAAFGAAATVLAGVAGLGARMMTRIESRFEKIDMRFEKIDVRFERLEAELVEVKIAVARLEGPSPRLLHAPRG